jgi:quercetin dioxygenase-like cupin family protein
VLHEADIPFEGVRAWILQAAASQLVFFEFEAGDILPAHNHTCMQWGMVIDGEMELFIDGAQRSCAKGDEYVIPPGTKHYAEFFRRTRVMDYFSEKSRYNAKKKHPVQAKAEG